MDFYCIRDTNYKYHYYRDKTTFKRYWKQHARHAKYCKSLGFGIDAVATTIICNDGNPEWKEIRRV